MSEIDSFSRLLVFGCGKMGGAILNATLKAGIHPENIRAVDPDKGIRRELADRGIQSAEEISAFIDFPADILLAAVKPFLIEETIGNLKAFTEKGTILLSIIAGRETSWFQEKLGHQASLVRAMPNTPAAVGRGITALYAGNNMNEAKKHAVDQLMLTCGETLWLKDENLMDAVTAVSGSGPAYVFYLTEALAAAAKNAGLPDDVAEKLARATVCGAAELMYQNHISPETLRKNVTTPNGTTAAALDILMNPSSGFLPLMEKAVAAAQQRSKELATA